MDDSKKDYTTATLLLFSFMGITPLGALAEEINQLETINVSATAESKTLAGKDEVYSKNNVTEYKSKKEIETYKGHSVGELFNGINGVYSSDARNAGALTPNIRGIQGQGRIPVITDNTEQEVTVWRGYAGVQNRNYIDPFLISSISAEKGPALGRDLSNGVGGTIRMTTLEPSDIVKPGQKFGFEFKAETANNSVNKRPHPYEVGVDSRTLPDYGKTQLGEWAMYFRPGDERYKPRTHGRNKFFKDKAYRIAGAVKEDNYEFLAAYAYRSKGNYFAGRKGADKYGANLTKKEIDQITSDSGYANQLQDPFVPWIGFIYPPATEIPNTSMETKSTLLKGSIKLPHNQKISTGFRQSNIVYGEIMPSRLEPILEHAGTILEWPEAEVKQKAFSLGYDFNPENNKWINFNANAYYVENKARTNTGYGSPGDILFQDPIFNEEYGKARSEYIQASMYGSAADYGMTEEQFAQYLVQLKRQADEAFSKIKLTTPNIDGLLNTMPAQAQWTTDKHWGINASNKFELTPKLSLTVMANYKRENLHSYNVFKLWEDYRHLLGRKPYDMALNSIADNADANRWGKRNEFNTGFKFDYQPLDWLLLSAGARYTHYKSVDKGLQYRLRNANREDTRIREYQIKVERLATQEELDKYYQLQTTMIYDDQGQGKLPASTTLEDKEFYRKMEYASSGYILQDPIAWQPDEFGRYSLRNYPYYDGRAYQYNDKLTQTGTNLITEETDVPVYKIDDSLRRVIRTVTAEEWARLKKAERTAHAWAPSFGITVFPTENTRFYVRYDEVKRMPSIYEDTSGYASMELFLLTERKPEHSKNIEVGYIHDLHGFLPSSRRADIKLNYFHNVTRNVYDRDIFYRITQFDKRTLSGVELQARYDQGRFFADLALTYNIKNKFCDAATALIETGSNSEIIVNDSPAYPTCVNGGNYGGFLKNTIAPKYSITGNLGLRFFDERLQIGTRLQYHSNVKESRLRSLKEAGFSELGNERRWHPVFVVDAYASYAFNDNLSVELVGSNITDRYYLDPMARSSMPAPGRTIKLGLTASF